MSITYPPLFAGVGGVNAIVVANAYGIATDYLLIVVGLVGAVVGFGVWFVSPLPTENGGMGLGTPTPRKWGFTMQKQKDEH